MVSSCWCSGTRTSTSGRPSSRTGSGCKVWPEIPRTVEWKHGICEVLGLPHADQADIARAWQSILGKVRSWSDLERPLLTTVEQLIDFVTQDH